MGIKSGLLYLMKSSWNYYFYYYLPYLPPTVALYGMIVAKRHCRAVCPSFLRLNARAWTQREPSDPLY